MLMPCEVAVKSVMPALRALVAKELTRTYNLKQNEVADLLGVTQTAVSKYLRHVRGRVIEIEKVDEVQPIISEIVVLLASKRASRADLVERFCLACRIIRQKRLMCKLCRRSDPTMDVKLCVVCLSENLFCIPK